MSSIKYTFSISDDTLNGVVDLQALTEELFTSDITIALDHAAYEGDALDVWYKANLSGEEQTTLSGIISSHTGEPIDDTTSPFEIYVDSVHTISGSRHTGQLLDSQIPSNITRTSDLNSTANSLQNDIDTHVHDDRYFTQSEVQNNINTASGTLQSQLDGLTVSHSELEDLTNDDHPQYHTDVRGDSRYYTQTELTDGQLDSRYYTETELDSGQLDSRYYTESEVDSIIVTDHGALSGKGDDDHPQYLLVNGSRAVLGNLTILGNLTVTGTQFVSQTQEIQVSDNLLHVNADETGEGITSGRAGLEIDRGSLPDAFMVFCEYDDEFKVGVSGTNDQWYMDSMALTESERTEGYIPYWSQHAHPEITHWILTTSGSHHVDDLATKDYVDNALDNSSSIFGSEFQEDSDDSTSSTTSSSWQRKLRMTTGSLPSGKYRIGWYYEWQHLYWARDFDCRIQINDSTTIMQQRQEPKDYGSDQWYPASGYYYHSGSGVLNIDIDYRSSQSGKTSGIRRARLEIWRVS